MNNCSFCLHFKTKKKNKLRIFKNLNFFTKLKTFKTHFFKFLSFINLSCGHVMSHKKFGPDRFSCFDVYWIQTNRHPNKQTNKPNLYIEEEKTWFYRLNLSVQSREILQTKLRKYYKIHLSWETYLKPDKISSFSYIWLILLGW